MARVLPKQVEDKFADDLLALRRDIKVGSSSTGHDRLCLCASVTMLGRFLPHSKRISQRRERRRSRHSILRRIGRRYRRPAGIRERGRSLRGEIEANGRTFDLQSSICNP